MPRHESLALRVYRAALWLYPAAFRQRYGAEMTLLFRDMYRDARTSGGTLAALWLAVRLLADAARSIVAEWLTWTKHHPRKALTFASGLPVLGFIWLLLFGWVAAFTEIVLVPWDTSPNPPPHGTLARTVNNFFEIHPGGVVLAWLILIVSVLWMLRAVITHGSPALTWKFAIVALLFVVANVAVMSLTSAIIWHIFPAPYHRGDPGFHRALPQIILFTLQTLVYLRILRRIAEGKRGGAASTPPPKGLRPPDSHI